MIRGGYYKLQFSYLYTWLPFLGEFFSEFSLCFCPHFDAISFYSVRVDFFFFKRIYSAVGSIIAIDT